MPLRRRWGALAAAWLTACTYAGGPQPPAPTTTAGVPTTAPATIHREEYRYRFRPGTRLVYHLTVERRILVDRRGEGGDTSGLPAAADVTVIASGTFEYRVAAGPETGTFLLAVAGEYDSVEVAGTVDGEAVTEPAEVSELVDLGPEQSALVVDATGHVLDPRLGEEGEAGTPPIVPDGAIAGFMAPVLPTHPIGEGETWGETFSEMAMGAVPVEGVLEGRRVGSAEEGTVVFETVATTRAGEVDLAPLYREYLRSAAEPGDEPDRLDDLGFRIVVEPSETRATGRFDPGRGLPIATTVDSIDRTTTETSLPDPETGRYGHLLLELEIHQTLDYELVPGETR